MCDWELLQQYCRSGSQDAFTELVQRHIDLVYSADWRQVRSPESAQDVTQAVFADLARSAHTLKPGTVLPAWLYQVTRRAAVDLIRKESRRQIREATALEMTAMSTNTSEWSQIEPVLEEAMALLKPEDRAAILLRYFQNKNLREVGADLGLSEDGAQKRVSRATEKLRQLLKRRGVTAGTGTIALLLATEAVQSAPAGLSAAICSASFITTAALQSSAAVGLSKTIAMTTLQKTVLGVVFAAALGTGFYQVHRVLQLRARNLELEQRAEPLNQQLAALQQQQADSAMRLARAQQEIERLQRDVAELPKLRGQLAALQRTTKGAPRADEASNSARDADNLTAASWLARVDQLKQALQRDPQKSIPEIQLLNQQDWLNAAKDKLETEDDYRRALGTLRNATEDKVAAQLRPALADYLKANNGQFPQNVADLQSFLKSPLDPAILGRFSVLPADAVPNVRVGGDWMITQNTFEDPQYDLHFVIGADGYGTTNMKDTPLDKLLPAIQAFSAANGGQAPKDPSQLQPFLTTVDQENALKNLTRSAGGTSNP